jgi:protein involved in polysaccharide export with SLBB domain
MQKWYYFLLLYVFGVLAHAETNYLQTGVNFETRDPISLQPMSLGTVADSSYVLGPGDFLEVYLENNSMSLQVSAEGTIAIEEVGVIHLNGVSLGQARRLILEKLAMRYDASRCYVHLIRPKNMALQIYGAVGVPGQYHVPPETRLSFLIRLAGRVNHIGDDSAVQIYRGGDTLVVNYHKVEMEGSEEDLLLQPGDVVFIPVVKMTQDLILISIRVGSNDQVFRTPWKASSTVQEYLLAAGVYHSAAQFNSVRVLKADGSVRYEGPEGEVSQKSIEKGDRIELNQARYVVYVGGASTVPGALPYNPEYKVLDYMAASGLLTVSGDISRVTIQHRDGSSEDYSPDMTVRPGDYIYVPRTMYENVKDFLYFSISILAVISSAITIRESL